MLPRAPTSPLRTISCSIVDDGGRGAGCVVSSPVGPPKTGNKSDAGVTRQFVDCILRNPNRLHCDIITTNPDSKRRRSRAALILPCQSVRLRPRLGHYETLRL